MKSGFFIVSIVFISTNVLSQEYGNSKYKDKVQIVTSTYVTFNSDNRPSDTIIKKQTFSKNGLITSDVLISDSRIQRTAFIYDSDKHLLEEQSTVSNKTDTGAIYSSKLKNEYSDNKLIKTTLFDLHGVKFTAQIEYDSNGCEVKKHKWGLSDSSQITYQNAPNGRHLTSIETTGNDTIVVTFMYDRRGNPISENRTSKFHGRSKTFYSYTKEGLVSQRMTEDDRRVRLKQVHKYQQRDSKGNYRKEEIFLNGKLRTVISRDIQYF